MSPTQHSFFAVPFFCLIAAPTSFAQTQRASIATSGIQSDGLSGEASVSADGRVIAFASYATNLVPGDTNNARDVFVRDSLTGTTERVSIATGGGEANDSSGFPSISGDGRYVAFASVATNLVAGDTNAQSDIFVHDRATGQTERVSVRSNGAQATYPSLRPSISADGRFVVFLGQDLLPGVIGFDNVFLRDRLNGTTELVSHSASGALADQPCMAPSISADNRRVAFASRATNLGSGTTHITQAYVFDRTSGIMRVVSTSSGGAVGNNHSGEVIDGGLTEAGMQIAADGRYVVFQSDASNLAPGPTWAMHGVFVKDLDTDQTLRASIWPTGMIAGFITDRPTISREGRFVSFESHGPGQAGYPAAGGREIYVRDMFTSRTTLESANDNGADANDYAVEGFLSADGSTLAFQSFGTNLVHGDTNATADVFVHARTITNIATYCRAEASSLGCAPVVSWTGTPSASAPSGFVIQAANVIGQQSAILFYGRNGTAETPFHGGGLCVQGPLVRTSMLASGGTASTCTGALAFDFDAWIAGGHDPALVAGSNVWAQFLVRDPGSAGGVNTSGALFFTIQP